jgi:hypothetical protein
LLAVGLTLLLFLFWWFIGYAVISVLRRRRLLQNMLLAPVIGTALCVLLVFWGNRAGIPIRSLGPPLAACVLLAAALIWWRGGVIVPWRQYLPFVGVLVFALVLLGWPLFEFGVNWVSISNEDMANYCLAAQRVFRHGFFEGLSLEDLAQNKEISAYYWYMHVPKSARPGSEMMLAFIMSLTGLSPHHAFMPLILSLHMSLVSAVGALTLLNDKLRSWTLMALVIFSCSAEGSLGTIYQWIAQVYGLSLLAAAATLFMFLSAEVRGSRVLKQGVLIGLVFSAAMVVYTEMVPMLGLACVFYLVRQFMKRRMLPDFRQYAIAGLVCIIALNSYLWAAVTYMFSQTRSGTSAHFGSDAGGAVMYPFFLLPSGLANFWGLFPYYKIPGDPFVSLGIALGGLLLIFSIAGALWEAWHGTPVALVCLSLLTGSLVLVVNGADYGLFKMAMFIQPFLLPTIVCAWMRFTGARHNESPAH